MQTLEIQVPDDKTNIVKDFFKRLGVKVKIKKTVKIPNADTIAAIAELKDGKGIRFNSVESFLTAFDFGSFHYCHIHKIFKGSKIIKKEVFSCSTIT